MVRNKIGRPPLPAGSSGLGKSIEKHPLFAEIYEMLCMRWSSTSILSILGSMYRQQLTSGEIPPLPVQRTIRYYRAEHLPAAAIMPAWLIEEKLDKLDIKIDLFKSLQMAYKIAENRVAKNWETEQKMNLPMSGVDRCYETLLKTGEMMWRVGQDLGVFPRQLPIDVTIAAGHGAQVSSSVFVINGEKKTVQMMSPEELDMSEAILKRQLEDD